MQDFRRTSPQASGRQGPCGDAIATGSGATLPLRRSPGKSAPLGAITCDEARAATDGAGAAVERTTYRPFGEEVEQTLSLTTPKETRGFIGERFDDTSGLQYLNAR